MKLQLKFFEILTKPKDQRLLLRSVSLIMESLTLPELWVVWLITTSKVEFSQEL